MKNKANEGKSLFWADQLAGEILARKRFHYLDRPVPRFGEHVVKTAASLSGVLHIGRLSDTIRCDSVRMSLEEAGRKAKLIWVADNMDPLRKVPKGSPGSHSEYIGVPVTDIPDPEGCHRSYADHHMSEYLKVVRTFVSGRMETYSMRDEYRKGSFRPEIGKIIGAWQEIVGIQNKYRPKDSPLRKDWFPWTPICENCGKIITTRFVSFDGSCVKYQCSDYMFEHATAKGCGHKGTDDPMKGNGKLLYKGELAMQWAHWGVCSEGFGKEYQVPGSAFWINAEIAERVLGFPMPVPIFYEHLLIEGGKMSASVGNVVYPADWLKVAPPELLRFLYNKKLMKARSFSWTGLPMLYDDFDLHERVYFGKERISNGREREHMKRLYRISQTALPERMPARIPFDFAVTMAQIFPDERVEGAMEAFRQSGHIRGRLSKGDAEAIRSRLAYARRWAAAHAPEQYRIRLAEKPREGLRLSEGQKKSIAGLAGILEKKRMSQDRLHSAFWDIAKEAGITPQEFFSGVYRILIGKESGPKLAPFILAVGQRRVAGLLRQAERT